MAVGCYGGIVFSVSDRKVLTLNNLSGSTGSDWATHSTIYGKDRSQYMGPKLKKYKFDISLNALYGVRPRRLLKQLQAMAESGAVYYLIIGGSPIGTNPFKLTDVSDEWDCVLNGGELVECKVSLTLEEYK